LQQELRKKTTNSYGGKMHSLRQKLITFAVDPETDLSKIKSGLAVMEEEDISQLNSGFLSEKQALSFAGEIHRSTLWNWRQKGLRSFKVNGRRLYDPADLREFITGKQCEKN
jgi:hypothetical protein